MKLSHLVSALVVLVCASAVLADEMMPLPAYGNSYTGNVRGYWFEAPVDFVITGLRVPDEMNVGVQSVEVVKFDGNTPPPAYPLTTNAFVSQARFVDEPSANILAVNIPVATGEVIGIYGQCGGTCSYGTPSGPFLTTILGMPTTLAQWDAVHVELGPDARHLAGGGIPGQSRRDVLRSRAGHAWLAGPGGNCAAATALAPRRATRATFKGSPPSGDPFSFACSPRQGSITPDPSRLGLRSVAAWPGPARRRAARRRRRARRPDAPISARSPARPCRNRPAPACRAGRRP